MAHFLYHYVGPADIREAAIAQSPGGSPIRCSDECAEWLASQRGDREPDGSLIATFVISLDGALLLAPRRSEHIACSGGASVLSAGEITFAADGTVSGISNQSTGFCPEPGSWLVVKAALDAIPLEHPDEFTVRITFRLCPQCGERNIVKDAWFVCDLCQADLPRKWNFDRS